MVDCAQLPSSTGAEASVLRNLTWEGVTSSWDVRAVTIPTP